MHLQEKEALLESIGRSQEQRPMESYEEVCIEPRARHQECDPAILLSREKVIENINHYCEWPPAEGKSISTHMLNHYLSNPAEYPIPGAL